MPLRLATLACSAALLLLSAPVLAASDNDSDLADRANDLARCMERTMGKGWQARYDIHMMTNRWGGSEPMAQDIESAPEVIRVTAMRCRRELNLTAQPQS